MRGGPAAREGSIQRSDPDVCQTRSVYNFSTREWWIREPVGLSTAPDTSLLTLANLPRTGRGTSVTATAAEPLTPAFAADFLADLTKKIEARDIEAIMAMCSDDVVFQDAGPSSEIDREEMRRMWTPIFASMEHAEVTLLDSFLGVEGDTVAAHWRYRFRRHDLVEPIVIETVAIYAFRNGMIARWTAIFRNSDWMGDLWP